MKKYKITIRGLVQGIGYRPFVAELAEKYNIAGNVCNDGGIVIVELYCNMLGQAEDFARRLETDAPWGALVQSVALEELTDDASDIDDITAMDKFTIIPSRIENKAIPFIPADIATCDRCTEELHDSNNRRYKHGFISCVSCGPRYSIMEALPYDRPRITMKDFVLCPVCTKEYVEKGNIRRHAQTICCPDCGPVLTWKCIGNKSQSDAEIQISDRLDEAIKAAADHLKKGGIVAMKDIGGYHLICDPYNEEAVSELRRLKGRESKPFAVCFPDIESIEDYCHINAEEKKAIESPARPIVLLKKRDNYKKEAFPFSVSGNSRDIGSMLPCNPQQILLTEACGPLIMTSGNGSGELLLISDNDMEAWLEDNMTEHSIGILSHNRPILTPLDDSVVRVVKGRTIIVRRARGYVPHPINAVWSNKESLFAAGGDLKSVFTYVEDNRAYLSSHLGDLLDEGSQKEYVAQRQRMRGLFGFEPGKAACDKHPGYFSRELASLLAFSHQIDLPSNGIMQREVAEIQHHKAHIASVVAEHNLSGNIIGFAFDGTGYGDDGSIWGSEVFSWTNCQSSGQDNMKRIGHIAQVELIGGDEGARNTDTILKGYLSNYSLNGDDAADVLVDRAIKMHINTVQSTSMGRLFDAVASLLGCCHYNSYEGEAPIELENLARTVLDQQIISCNNAKGDSLLNIEDVMSKDYILETGKIIRTMLELKDKVSPAILARGFINLISEYIIAICEIQREEDDIRQVVLSGGSFNNRILLERTISVLEEKGFDVYVNEQVPCSDGGLCLGQAYLACKEEPCR